MESHKPHILKIRMDDKTKAAFDEMFALSGDKDVSHLIAKAFALYRKYIDIERNGSKLTIVDNDDERKGLFIDNG